MLTKQLQELKKKHQQKSNFYTPNGLHVFFKDKINNENVDMEKVIAFYMREAIKSDRTTVYNAIKDSGNPKLAEYIRRM